MTENADHWWDYEQLNMKLNTSYVHVCAVFCIRNATTKCIQTKKFKHIGGGIIN